MQEKLEKDSFTLHSIIMKNEKNKIFQIMREQEFYKALRKKLRILCFVFPKDFSQFEKMSKKTFNIKVS